ncbi:MAG: hypothetical protein U5R48_17090 [Gammaproteobacteria bacterium]|nr:hypothetical protein [Gammaproteobacteria bacterium]
MAAFGPERDFADADALVEAIAASDPVLAGVRDAAPPGDWRDVGGLRVARAPARQSGRTALHAHLDLNEPVPPVDADSPLAWSMEGTNRPASPAALTPYYWAPRWNSNQAVTRFQEEVAGPLRGGEVGRRLSTGGTSPEEGCEASPRTIGRMRRGIRGRVRTMSRCHRELDSSSRRIPSGRESCASPSRQSFGSDELTARAPALAERMPVPRLVVAPELAEAYGLTAGEGVRLRVDGADRGVFRLESEPVMAPDWVAVSCGLPGTPGSTPGGRVTLEAVPDWTPPAPDGVIARG